MDDSSDDSDICEGSKNVQSMLVKLRISQEELNDYAYKRRLGDLIFDANFESGNLGFVENIDRYEYDLMVRPDVFNVKHRIWFNFKVSNQRYDQCVVLTIVNLSENLKLFHEGFCPVMRSEKRPKWTSLNEEQVFYYRSQNHGNRFVLSLVIRFSTQDDEHQLALFYPYSNHNLCQFLDRWLVELKRLQVRRAKMKMKQRADSSSDKRIISKSPEPFQRGFNHHRRLLDQDDDNLRTRSSLETRRDCPETIEPDGGYDLDFTVDIIAEGILLKPIYCVSIGSPSGAATKLPMVVIICRASSGNMDTVSSFVCQGLMDYLFSDSLVAQAARDSINFTILPMVDPDSICSGNSRTNLLGQQADELTALDTTADSRPYSNHSAIQKKLGSMFATDEAGVTRRQIVMELGVDLDLMGSRVLGWHFVNSRRMERHLLLPKAMSKFIEGFYLEACRFSSSDEDGLRPSWIRHHIPIHSNNNVDYYQLELSPFGSFKRSLEVRDYLRYDQVSYLTIGKGLVYSLVEALRPKRVDNVSSILDRFQHDPNNAEELTLNMAKLH